MSLLYLLKYVLSGKIIEQWSVGDYRWDGKRKLMGQHEENNDFASKLLYCNLN